MEVRLAYLTHAELVELAAEGCRKDAALKAKANALIAAAAPIGGWIKDAVLFSPDLAPLLIRCCMSTRHYEHPLGAVACVCRLWSQLWSQLLLEEPVVRPLQEGALVPLGESALQPWKGIGTLNARVVQRLPNGCLCIGTEADTSHMNAECCRELRIFSPQAEVLRVVDAVTDIVAVACYDEVVFVAHHDGAWGLGTITRFSLDFALLGNWPLNDVFGSWVVGSTTRAHQMACTRHALCITDPDKVSILHISSGALMGTALPDTLPSSVAADDDSFYVSCLSDHSVKRLNANGEILHSFQGNFHYPIELAVLNGSLFLMESRGCMWTELKGEHDVEREERELVGRRLFVLDLRSGSQRQIMRLERVLDSLSDSDDTMTNEKREIRGAVGLCVLGVNQLGLYDIDDGRWALLHVPASATDVARE